MRKVFIVFMALLAGVFLATCVFAAVPGVSPDDFGGAALVPATQDANWLWQLLITDEAVRVFNWLLTAGISGLMGWLGFKGTRLAQCVMYIAAGVRAIYFSFVRPAKQASKHGKLSEHDRVVAMDTALEYARKLATAKGFELFKYLSKDVATAIAEFCVRIFKGGGKKTEVLVPLPDSAPLPPSVTQGMKSASTSAVSG